MTGPTTIIGRQAGNVHLHLPSSMISRQHAIIERNQQTVSLFFWNLHMEEHYT